MHCHWAKVSTLSIKIKCISDFMTSMTSKLSSAIRDSNSYFRFFTHVHYSILPYSLSTKRCVPHSVLIA